MKKILVFLLISLLSIVLMGCNMVFINEIPYESTDELGRVAIKNRDGFEVKIYDESPYVVFEKDYGNNNFPIFKFEKVDDIEAFKQSFGSNVIDLNQGDKSFNSITSNYDEAFFNNKSVIMIYEERGIQGIIPRIEKKIDEKTLLFNLYENGEDNEAYAQASGQYFYFIELDKTELEEIDFIEAHKVKNAD